ncbi:MAG: hypothetical protein WBG92_12695 [Thiohalocapsa sp.]
MKPNTHRLSILVSAAAIAIGAMTPSQAELAADTPEYKCFVTLTDRTRAVVFFYDPGPLPSRFSDADNIAHAKLPDSMRTGIARFHECLLRELDFADPFAQQLETRTPQ